VTRALGGKSGSYNAGNTAGGANTGTGGDNGTTLNSAGLAGGKGVVIIRQPIQFKQATTLTVGTVSTTETHIIYTFNDSGTIGWS
jgi:hypothetical protein